MKYLPTTAHVTLLATLRRERLLPLAGTVIVQARQQVGPSDVVARPVLATGALLEGVWGNGREDTALLRVVGDSPRTSLTPNLVSVDLRGAIVVAGTLADPASLKQLGDVGVRGLLVGSLAAALLPAALKAGF